MSEPAIITATIGRPEPTEHSPYHERYISLVPGCDILGTLESQRRQTLILLSGRDDQEGNFRYAPDKWSAKEDVGNGPFAHRPIAEIIEDYIAVRRATLTLFRNLDEQAWMRRGIVNNNEISVRALAFITAGHELHHRRILEEKYFAGR